MLFNSILIWLLLMNRNRLYKSLFPAHQKRNPAGASFHPSFGDGQLARRMRARVYQLSFLYLPFFQLQVKPKKNKIPKKEFNNWLDPFWNDKSTGKFERPVTFCFVLFLGKVFEHGYSIGFVSQDLRELRLERHWSQLAGPVAWSHRRPTLRLLAEDQLQSRLRHWQLSTARYQR